MAQEAGFGGRWGGYRFNPGSVRTVNGWIFVSFIKDIFATVSSA
jgi:hypothetical protein